MVTDSSTHDDANCRSIRAATRCYTQIRVILDQIRGRTYEDALMILEYMPHRACEPILKLLVSVRLRPYLSQLTSLCMFVPTLVVCTALYTTHARRRPPTQSKTMVCARASWW